ncbi:hypothetical protein [Methylocystis sp. S23]
MTTLTTAQLAHCLGRTVASLTKLRNRYASFPRPQINPPALLYDAAAVREWIVANQGSLSPTYPNEKALDLDLFDARVAMITV